MTVEAWIHFEEGEKEQLKQLMDKNPDKIMANLAIQETFGLDLVDANTVIETYYKRIKK
jgi:hypothetical protein